MRSNKITLFLILLIALCVATCNQEEDESVPPPIYIYKMSENLEIFKNERLYQRPDGRYSSTFSIGEGDKIVFEYTYIVPCDHHYFSESIYFHIENDETFFTYVDDHILETNCFYDRRGCLCPDYGQHEVKYGKLAGLKLNDDEWLIEIDVTIIGWDKETSYHIDVSEVFRK